MSYEKFEVVYVCNSIRARTRKPGKWTVNTVLKSLGPVHLHHTPVPHTTWGAMSDSPELRAASPHCYRLEFTVLYQGPEASGRQKLCYWLCNRWEAYFRPDYRDWSIQTSIRFQSILSRLSRLLQITRSGNSEYLIPNPIFSTICSWCLGWLVSYELGTTRVIWEAVTSTEKTFPVGNPVRHFLDCRGRAQLTVRGAIPWLAVLVAMRKHTEQARGRSQ